MLLVKLIGGIVVIIAFTFLGLFKSKELENRVEHLKDLICLFQLLETQICFMSNVLSEAFSNSAKVFADKPVSKVFESFSENLRDGFTANVAWKESISKWVNCLYLNSSDEKILLSFGDSILTPDIDGQIKNIKFILIQLNKQLEIAQADRDNKKKLYLNLGVLSGLAIVIVLI